MPPAYEVLLLNTAVPQIQAAQSGDTYVVPRDIAFSAALTLTAGTANGVPYLSSPGKVLTTGSALTFDGTNLSSTGGATLLGGPIGYGGGEVVLGPTTSGVTSAVLTQAAGAPILFFDHRGTSNTGVFAWRNGTGSSNELMRLTSTGLGIGTNNPTQKLDVRAAAGGIYLSSTTGTNQVALQTNNSGGDFYFGIDNSAGNNFNTNTAYAGVLWRSGANPICFVNNSTEKMRLDSSGNLGLGVTPSAWASGVKALQIGSYSSLYDQTGATVVGNNFYNIVAGSRYLNTNNASAYVQTTGQHQWFTAPSGTAGNAISFTQAMTLDASGNLGIGTTSPINNSGYGGLSLNGTSGALFSLMTNGTESSRIASLGNETSVQCKATTGYITFVQGVTGGTERARITSGGYFKASDNGTYVSSTGTYHELDQSANQETLVLNSTNASQTFTTLLIQSARNTTNNTYYAIDYYNTGAAAYKFRVADSGNVTNTNGSYGTISDAKMKTDIVDAGSQWADIKAVRFRKFKMKDDPEQVVQLGVVAQEIEQTSPGLVEQHTDRDQEGNDLGTTTKSVKTSVLLMKAAVALQEAMARIEKLEAEVAALKGA